MTSRDHLKTFSERKCSKPWQEIKSWELVHRGPVKLQGKNAAIAVPAIGENLCQPWELSLKQVRGICAGPPLHPWLRPCWEGLQDSYNTGQGCGGLFQCCSHAALQLLSEEAESANQSNGLGVTAGMFAQTSHFLALISLNYKSPFSILESLICFT